RALLWPWAPQESLHPPQQPCAAPCLAHMRTPCVVTWCLPVGTPHGLVVSERLKPLWHGILESLWMEVMAMTATEHGNPLWHGCRPLPRRVPVRLVTRVSHGRRGMSRSFLPDGGDDEAPCDSHRSPRHVCTTTLFFYVDSEGRRTRRRGTAAHVAQRPSDRGH